MSRDSPIEEAYSYIAEQRDNVQVRIGSREIFDYQLSRVIEEELSIDVHEKRITYLELRKTLKDVLIEIKKDELRGGSYGDLEGEFRKRSGRALSELMSEGYEQYVLAFPLNLGLIESVIDDLYALEGGFERIDQERWVNDYFDVAKDEDDMFLDEFLEVSPNDFLDSRFAYYQIQYEARSSGYALARVQDLANLAVGKLNYCLHQHDRASPHPKSNKLPYETWSALREPAFYLVFQDGEYQFLRPTDYGYRRTLKSSQRRAQKAEEFYDLPKLDESNPVDRDLLSAFLTYQDGMSEISVRKSFFSFWRGIERLSQTDSPKSAVTERCRFAFEYARNDEMVHPTHEKAHKEIHDKRNMVAHEGVDIFVGDDHRNYTKKLLDGMIELYLQHRLEFDQEDFETFLEYGVEYREGAGKIISILQRSGFEDLS